MATKEKGYITGIYESSSYWLNGFLVARGITSRGKGFSITPLKLDDNLQPFVGLPDGEIITEIKPKKPKTKNTSSQS